MLALTVPDLSGTHLKGNDQMRKSVKLILTALAASLLLSAAVGTASARNLSVSNRNIRATWARLEFEVGGGSTVICPVTLEGSFHSQTVAKVRNSLIGAVTRATVKQESCEGGTGAAFNGVDRYNGTTTPNTLPWHITYDSFAGTLPTITSVRILLSRFRFGIERSPCAVQVGNETDIVFADAALGAGGVVNSLTPVEGSNRATIIRTDRDFLGACPRPGATGVLKGTGSVMLLGTTTRISITLI